MAEIVAVRDRIGRHGAFDHRARTDGARVRREMREHRRLEDGERGHRLGQKIVRPGVERGTAERIIAGCREDDRHPRSASGEVADQAQARSVRQAEVDQRDRRAIDGEVAGGGRERIGAPDARARAQAEKPHRFTGEAAVFDHQHRLAHQRTFGRGTAGRDHVGGKVRHFVSPGQCIPEGLGRRLDNGGLRGRVLWPLAATARASHNPGERRRCR